jgi:acyl-CoA reductase-like NAD-dependent aldehyde dehydrogenase
MDFSKKELLLEPMPKQLQDQKMIHVLNPFTQEIVGSLAVAKSSDVDAALLSAHRGLDICRALPRHQRASILLATANIVREQQQDFATLIVQEAGKTIVQARTEVSRCINTLELSAEEAKRLSGEVIPFDAYEGAMGRQGYTHCDPLGIILAITPFNDPLNLVAHKLGPAVAGGNAVILKPSEHAPLSAIKLVDAFVNAGLDKSIISVVVGDAEMGRHLVASDDIRMVSFTGGMATGEAITRIAGLKKMAMDLGGNAPVIVMADSDLDAAVQATVSGAFWASGQNCIGTQRIFVERSVFDQFASEFVAQTRQLHVGDPMDENTDVGPMITLEQAKRINAWVSNAINQGATLLEGHHRQGNFYHPTVLTNVPKNSQVSTEEVFAPVVILEPFDSFDEVINKANSVDYSLHAGIFTSNLELALTAADRLQASGVMINDSSDFRFDAMPFGGYKRGSLGREGVRYALQEMTQTKVVCFKRG